ncbi:cytochrome C oxidase subunit I [Parachitinimonas caeni]|uniref:Cytochrome C oxidase subunit I n=1 Tax=Parachitinimonas caeni TaxID=3031301 RepID=A0ABT7DV97_9NEIS|nr:cytochrome C oxidase subunit I [Parachitinimonas caeni]MDK2123995.1 cytochrome C oxidase subunit I [Parachitinimonas caeni]
MEQMQGDAIKRGRRFFLMLALISAAPVALSYFSYYFWKPKTGLSYGELLPTQPLKPMPLKDEYGNSASLVGLRGKWLLLVADGAACKEKCQDALFAIRQLRLAQGKEMERVERVWLITDGGQISPAMKNFSHGAKILSLSGENTLPVKDGEAASQYIYLIDPLGNQVMRYARDADKMKIIRELTKLLKYNEAIG